MSKKAEKSKKTSTPTTLSNDHQEADASENPHTVFGEKKNLAREMAKAYSPSSVEAQCALLLSALLFSTLYMMMRLLPLRVIVAFLTQLV